MNCHLVTIEIGVKSFTDQRVQVNGVTLDQSWLEGLNPHPVKRGSTIQQHRVICDHLLKDIPDFFILPLQHLLGRFDRIGVAKFFQSSDDERLIKFECDFLGETTLMQLQSRSNNNHTSSRVIDAFAKQVFAETTLFTLNHIGQGFQRSIRRTQNGSFAAIVIEQSIN